ncbi:MAG: carbohydrate ABC transporter permease [Lachnospiraceae bacterium]|nr:carbohydrate ABC transporter permease [Lachnospiraceae bacterium]
MVKKKNRVCRTVFGVLVALVLFIQLYPIFYIIISSFKSSVDFANNPPYTLPTEFFIGNYVTAFTQSHLLRYFLNSIVIAVFTLLLLVILGAPASYAIAKIHFKFDKAILAFFLMGIMIPTFVTLLPMFRMYNILGLRNTYASLIIPQVGFGLPMCIYLYTGFLEYIPNSLIESAQLDGASQFRTFLSIVFPLMKNTTMTVLTLNFINVWNEFTFANTFLTSNEMKTIPLGLMDFNGLFGLKDWGAIFAAITITMLPTLIIYFILNKQVIAGMAAGAVKG